MQQAELGLFHAHYATLQEILHNADWYTNPTSKHPMSLRSFKYQRAAW